MDVKRWGWLAPPVILTLAVYAQVLNGWFQRDDIPCLTLVDRIGNGWNWWQAFFAPIAQGTIRPLSERAVYIGFRWLFDLNGLPYHALTLATQLGSVILMALVGNALTGSRWAGMLAASLWAAHPALFWPMSWVCAYNQVLISFVWLLAMWMLVRGRDLWHWAVYLAGFGVLELNVMYPAVAMAYCWWFDRARLKQAALMLVPAGLYAVAHNSLASKASQGTYALKLDAGFVHVAGEYLKMAMWQPLWWLTAAVLVALFVWKRDRTVWLGLVWFTAAIGPFLLLPNHVSDYYLMVPLIGLSLAAGHVFAAARAPGIAMGLALVLFSAPVSYRLSKQAVRASREVERMVMAVQQIHESHPRQTILLKGVSNLLFWDGVYDRPFERLLGLRDVHLTPESISAIVPAPELCDLRDYTLATDEVTARLAAGRAVVYEITPDRVRNITRAYQQLMR